MKIITGFTGEKHITPADDAGLIKGIFGQDDYVLPVGSQFATTIPSNTEIRIADGELVMQGRHARLDSEHESVIIANGEQVMNRHDLIVARYTKDTSTSVESIQLAVITGNAAITATDPEYNTGDIDSGETRDFPLYRVKINGITIEAVEQLWKPAITSIELGGTNATNVADARRNLGLGNVAVENILPVSKGGTGKTNATDARMNLGIYREFVNGTLWTSENVASGSDAAIIVIPFLRLCFMRAYIVPKRVFAANEQYGVITVPEAYRPAYGHALNIHVGGRVLAKSRVAGESGYVYVTPNVETNYEMYITGMWYY